MSPKKIAIRTCIGCQQRRPQEELWKFGPRRTTPPEALAKGGRRGYLCHDKECFEKAVKKNAFSRALKRKVSEKEQNELRQEFEKEIKKEKESKQPVPALPMAGGDGNGPC